VPTLTDPLSADEYIALIPSELYLDTANNPDLPSQISTLWRLNLDKAFDLKLQYFYTKLATVMWLLEQGWRYFNFAEGDVQKQKKALFDNLLALAKLLQSQITAIENGLLRSEDALCSRIIVETYRNPDSTWDTPYNRRATPVAFNLVIDQYPLTDRIIP
jgi:hypothetical protein